MKVNPRQLFWSVKRRRWEFPPEGTYGAVRRHGRVFLFQGKEVTHVMRPVEGKVAVIR